MLRILHTAAAQINLPMDLTGAEARDPIAAAKLAKVMKMKGGLLAGLRVEATSGKSDRAVATLATNPGHASANSGLPLYVRPIGWIINPADGWEYYNKPGIASFKVPVLPLVAGTIIEVDHEVFADYTAATLAAGYGTDSQVLEPGSVLYLGSEGQLTATVAAAATNQVNLDPIAVVVENDDTPAQDHANWRRLVVLPNLAARAAEL